ncbi:hypothetical protein C8J42_11249 [Sphingomonas sp. PP-CE-1A-559]|uniref:hypothetical protein n=1 Tax=Sphingomonas sp. PP-CE-1A-559 TaxID=2135657 RepID=UPI0010552CEF|nr:hypothetical protein [Sphingomonas sp. PP-CE-1A-559]TCP86358.1 hypothetical protein C8J42_11249 [Sphingomonas sp. PP-CE-1A-559]
MHEFSSDTFGDVTAGSERAPLSHADTIRNGVVQAVVADQAGIDFFGLGKHHRRWRERSSTLKSSAGHCT